MHYLEFERPIAELEGKIVELQKLAEADPHHGYRGPDVARCKTRAGEMVRDTYARLTPWQKVQVARHPGRPHFLDYARRSSTISRRWRATASSARTRPLSAGWRAFAAGRWPSSARSAATTPKVAHQAQFRHGMPEGYRKAVRMFELAGPLSVAGAVLCRHLRRLSRRHRRGTRPGRSHRPFHRCRPVAEGALHRHHHRRRRSGGAIAIAAANRVYMLEHAVYSVISPEGAASILWRSADKAQEAATALKITAQDLRN
jgi:acetyl-CoA carboxylase carboxyl transferase subunit alpha